MPSWVGHGQRRDDEDQEAFTPAEPQLREGVAGERGEEDDRQGDHRRDDDAVAEGEPEGDGVEHLADVLPEQSTGEQGRPGRREHGAGAGAGDERPPQRVGAADEHGEQQAVGEEAGAAVDAEGPALRFARFPGLRRLRRFRCGDGSPVVGDLAHILSSSAAAASARAPSALSCWCCASFLRRPFPADARLGRRDAPRDQEVEHTEDDDDQEEHPGDGGCATEVATVERHVPQIEHGRLVLPLGPPGTALDGLNSFGSVKIWRPPMVAVMITKIMVGRMLGSVIEKNRRKPPAPSSAADSCRSRGTACMAASRMRAL